MESQRRPPPGFGGRPPQQQEGGAPATQSTGAPNLGGFGQEAAHAQAPFMRLVQGGQAPPPMHAPPPHAQQVHGPPGGGYGYPGTWTGAPGGGYAPQPAPGHHSSGFAHAPPPYAPPPPHAYPPHMRIPPPLQGAVPPPPHTHTTAHDDGARFILRAAPGAPPPPPLPQGVIGDFPPELRVAGDGGALLRLLQQRQAQQPEPLPQPRPFGGASHASAAASAAAAAALAGLRLDNGTGAPPQQAAPGMTQQIGFGGMSLRSFGAIGGHIGGGPPPGATWSGPPPPPQQQQPQYQQQQQPGQQPVQGLRQDMPPPQRVPPAPRPFPGAAAGAPPGMPPVARAPSAPMAMPPAPASPAPSAQQQRGTPPTDSPFGRSPTSAARVNQREVRQADQAARAADRDSTGGTPGRGGGGGGRGGGGGGSSRGGPVLKADAAALSAQLAALTSGLMPAPADTARQTACFERVRAMLQAEWPDAQLHLYGSCANGFGGAASDIDTCLALRWAESPERKRAVVQRIAELATAAGCRDVVALTHARMPVAKMVDAATGVACDVCVNNFLAVFNTRLLRDYAALDPRLRQLGYAVKHWAKRRRVNEPYTGTLSSYCYILMCIHLLQTRNPPVLPCLQAMTPHTFARDVDGTRCAYYDDVAALAGFGARNTQPVASLLAEFFDYWAHGHDYGGSVVSIRLGGFIGKRRKGWTTRVGTERHLICIEDPFEVSHDLGRVVDKRSINVLRDEFARAAQLLRTSPAPLEALFADYVAPNRAPGAPAGAEADEEDDAPPPFARALADSLPDFL